VRFAFLAAILNFALVFYLLRKSVKCILSARLFSKVQEDSKKLEYRRARTARFFQIDFQSGSTHSNGYVPHPNSRMEHHGRSDYSRSIGILTILLAENCV
jgi:hypothetical protein